MEPAGRNQERSMTMKPKPKSKITNALLKNKDQRREKRLEE